jgi:hypothetical protein
MWAAIAKIFDVDNASRHVTMVLPVSPHDRPLPCQIKALLAYVVCVSNGTPSGRFDYTHLGDGGAVVDKQRFSAAVEKTGHGPATREMVFCATSTTIAESRFLRQIVWQLLEVSLTAETIEMMTSVGVCLEFEAGSVCSDTGVIYRLIRVCVAYNETDVCYICSLRIVGRC